MYVWFFFIGRVAVCCDLYTWDKVSCSSDWLWTQTHNIAEGYGENPPVFTSQGLGFQKCVTILGQMFLLFCLFGFIVVCLGLDRVSLWSDGWPGTHYVDKGGFKLTETICLYLLSAGIKNVLPPCLWGQMFWYKHFSDRPAFSLCFGLRGTWGQTWRWKFCIAGSTSFLLSHHSF